MTSSLLSIGKSGLMAAQVGLATTGNNITNANVAGYSRQVAIQANAVSQKYGYGFVGTGTEISSVQRVYDSYLATAVNNAQSTTSSLDEYYSQVSQIDNLMSDTTSGLSPALQSFFASVQDVSATSSTTASRQALLSSAQSLVARFQSMSGRLQEIADGVNTQITSNVDIINSYASQIAELNTSISAISGGSNGPPNDLLDQRDQLVAELNKYVKTTATPADNNTINVSIGSGQPLVVGAKTFGLVATPSPTDSNRLEIGYVTPGRITVLPENAITGGSLGGLLEFRTNAMDVAQNSLGRIASSLAVAVNAQHALGVDLQGVAGGVFFNVAPAVVTGSSSNNPTSTTKITGTVVDGSALTTSNYDVTFDGSNYIVKRDSGETGPWTIPPNSSLEIEGVNFAVSGTAAQGDSYVVKPTVNGASGISLAISDVTKIAAAAPIVTAAPASNIGTGAISAGSVSDVYLEPGNALTPANPSVKLTYAAADPAVPGAKPTFTLDPATQTVTVVGADGTTTDYAPGVAVPYTEGDKLSFGGINITMTGAPRAGDTFTVSRNATGVGDSRNMALIGALQTTKLLDGGTANFQDAYASTVSYIGNKTREASVNGTASAALLAQTQTAQQSVSGVNLDEEAANLLRYQQAYQANGKVMQIASTLFDTLLSLGN